MKFFFKKTNGTLLGALLLVISLNPRLAFADPATSSQSFLIRPWAVGQTATYQINTLKNGNLVDSGLTTYSIVDEELVNGLAYFWIEIEQLKPDKAPLVVKLQIRKPRAIDFENYLRDYHGLLRGRRKILWRESAQHDPTEKQVPPDEVQSVENGQDPEATQDLTHEFATTSSQPVSVKAGVFNATGYYHPLGKQGDSSTHADGTPADSQFIMGWGSPQIPIWGLVKKITQTVGSDNTVTLRQTELVYYSEKGAGSKVKNPHQPILGVEKNIDERSKR